MPHTYLTQEEKARILAWRQEKVKIKEIVRRSGRAKSTVMALLAAASGLPPDVCPQYKPIPGRPRKTTKGTDNLLRREVLKNPRLTASQLKESHPKLLAKVSARTVRHRLQKDLKLPSRTAARKPLLNDRMRKARLAFAKKYSKRTKEQRAKVMWSDESTFQLFPSQHVKNIDGSTPSCSKSRTPAGPLSTESVSSEDSSEEHSPGLSISSSENELLLDEDMDLKLEIKEEEVNDALTEFVNVLDHVEAVPSPKEHDVDTLAVSKPSTCASPSNIQFVAINPPQLEIPSHLMEEAPVDVLAVTKPSITPSTSSASLRKVNPTIPRNEDADEFHLFGMFVASQLRALPLRDALQAQLEIQTIIAQKRSQSLT